MKSPQLLMLAGLAALGGAAHAADLRPQGVYVQGAAAKDATRIATVGVVWPWSWRRELGGGEATASTEVFLSRWSARADGERHGFTQVGVLPLLRYRFSQGRSPWYLEGGIGLSWMDPVYRTGHKEFSTRFNFVDVAGVGYSFGVQRRHELALRLTHVSNGGIRKPNPGENLVQLRYGWTY